jgi:phenylacetate-coenzyme A ligase PaaK-like adenylate-forming protein
MMDHVFDIPPFSMERTEKAEFLRSYLTEITRHHYENCDEYKRVIDALFGGMCETANLEELPFLPVNIFKQYELKSVSEDQVFKKMRSSGTSGQRPSQIILDKRTANLQTKGLTKTLYSILGSKRLPMLVIDSRDALGANGSFSARGAAIRGFSMFGRNPTFALDSNLKPNAEEIVRFFEENRGKPVFIFGFTFLVWSAMCEAMVELDLNIDMSNAVLLHGGGWKKLIERAVSATAFKDRLRQQFNITRVHDYYGMVEQTGSIYVECSEGHLHSSVFNEIVIKDPLTLKNKGKNDEGLIQTLSIFPHSYPGHSLLTEDLGVLLGEDDCPCGRKGKYFKVLGRASNAEVRGCSDTL